MSEEANERRAKTEKLLALLEKMSARDLAGFSAAMDETFDTGEARVVSAVPEPDPEWVHPLGWVAVTADEALAWFSGTPEELAAYMTVERSLTGFAPRQVETCIAVLHEMHESRRYRTVAELIAEHETLPPEQRYVRSPDEPRIRWRQLAERYGLPLGDSDAVRAFEDELNYGGRFHWSAWPPKRAGLDIATAAALIPLLSTATGSRECYIYEFYGQTDFPEFRRGPMEAWFGDEHADGWCFASWWPIDHAWHVYSDVDSAHSIIGGSVSLIDAIRRHPDLETVEVADPR